MALHAPYLHRVVPRAILATSGRPVLQRAFALWTAVGVVATVLFGGQGLDARRVTCMFHAGMGTRLAFAVGWTLLAGAVAHAPALPLGGAAGALAIPIACAIAAWARVHDRKTRRSPALFVIGVIGVGAIFTGVGVAW
jgi:hypothetical protein